MEKKDWKAKLESAYSFTLKYSKITVCGKYVASKLDKGKFLVNIC